MVKVVVLGAHGRVAQIVEKFLFADKDIQTSLFLRNASRMADKKNQATIFEGSATDAAQLEKAMKGQDIVYANLGGKDDIDLEAEATVEAMKNAHVKRLIWISTLGIYDEVSRKSVAAYVYHLIKYPKEDIGKSIGLGKPGTEGDKPSWY